MKKKYDDIKKELLIGMKDMLIGENVAAKYTEAGEDGYQVSMVHALIEELTEIGNDGLAEFFFMPETKGLEAYAILQSVVTFERELNMDTKAKFDAVANVINFYLETGSFAGDIDGSNYSLKVSVMVPLDGELATLKDIVNMNASQAILTATAYCNLFIKVAEGDMTLDEVKELVRN